MIDGSSERQSAWLESRCLLMISATEIPGIKTKLPGRSEAPSTPPVSQTTNVNAVQPAGLTFALKHPVTQRNGAERALQQFELAYQALLDGIKLEHFDPNKIENYIRLAEKRAGVDMSDKEKGRIRELVNTGDPDILKLVALELRVGISRKLEKEALAAFGELVIYHREQDALMQNFLSHPTKDENLKAYIRILIMMSRFERIMNSWHAMRDRYRRLTRSFKRGLIGLFSEDHDDRQPPRRHAFDDPH